MIKRLLTIFIISALAVVSCSRETQNDSSEKTKPGNDQGSKKDIVFIAKSENIVEVGEVFQLVYEVNETVDHFSPPELKNFDILSGPATSSYSSTQIINGKTTASISSTYTYNISCSTPGEYTIPPAEVIISGNIYKSNALTIKVSGNANQNQNHSNSVQNGNTVNSKDDIFIAVDYSKTSVYKGEWILATTKIYTKVDFQNISEVSFPDYTGFWTETIQAPRQIEFKNEQFNGELFQSAILKQTLIFAQNPGKYTISPYEIELQLKKKGGKGEDFFGNVVDTYKLVNKKLSTGKQTIIVKPLPQPAPEQFSGITGKNFTLNAEIEPLNIKTDESANLKLTISGIGNIYLLNELPLTLPEGLQSFKPELEKKDKNSENGPFGEHIFTYVIVGNKAGEYTIPPFEFVYFDPDKETYITIPSAAIKMTVGQGKAYVDTKNKENVQDNKDIRFIKEDHLYLKKKGHLFFGKPSYYLSFLILAGAFILLLYIRKKQAEKNADTENNRRKSAGKMSHKRLKTAYERLEHGNKQEFYKEILNALWNYLSDKISIQKEQLTKQHIETILKDKCVNDDIRKKLTDVIDVCGYAQYSPVGEEAQPQNIYNETMEILNELEKVL
jgi:hypothetical protein